MRAHHTSSDRVLMIGVGNDFRRDDGVGRIAARRLQELHIPHLRVVEATGEGTALMDTWHEASRVYLVDAVQSGAQPGTIHRFEAHREPIPSSFFHYSTHAFSVAEAIEMDRSFGQLPPQLIIYGVEGGDFSAGTELSPVVQVALEALMRQLADEINNEALAAEIYTK